ncbi:MAG TPA: amidohydrolase family protein [Chloroflexota bacterium]
MRGAFGTILLGLLLAATGFAPRQSAEPLPLFDAHLHYNADAWSVYDVDQALAILDRANVRVALVSSTPDDGTLKLYARAPDRVVPVLRPYRNRGDVESWTRDASIVPYLRARLEGAPPGLRYRGIGEFHLYSGQADRPVVAEIAQIARERDLFLHAHSDERAVGELLELYPEARVLWAHAGMSASPAAVGALLDRYPGRLWVELALRYDVAPGGALDPGWAALFERHPSRLMVGTDTWITPQWTRMPELKTAEQGWLRQLPPALAERLAWRNAACLFASDTTAIARPADGCEG